MEPLIWLETDPGERRSLVVKDLPADEQPREKLMRLGPEALSDAELVAILLRTGLPGRNVIDVSRDLIEQSGGLHRMARRGWLHLKQMPGIGAVKAVTLESALELSRRLSRWEPGTIVQFRHPQDVATYFGPALRDLRKEVFIIAFLNARKILLGYERISVGGQTATVVDPAEVMRQAILNDAHSIIAVHNHPSGNARASDADLALTRRLVEVGHLMGIALDDHVIIAGFDHISLRMQGGIAGW